METWILWALLSAITGGFYGFTFKMIAQRNYDTYIATILWYGTAALISLVAFLMRSWVPNIHEAFLMISILWFGNIFFYTASIMTRVEAMRNIDSVIFFPLYKTFGPIMVTWISLTVFKEHLDIKDVFGIIAGISVPLLLITRNENRIQKHLFKWVILVLITAILTSISSIIPKYIQVLHLDIEFFILMSFFFGIFFSLGGYHFHSKKSKKKYETHGLIKFWILTGVIHYLAFYTFMRAMEWNLAIAFTINSFSILIPIILSIIFYGEHFNLKKWIVIGLSIVSILLFI